MSMTRRLRGLGTDAIRTAALDVLNPGAIDAAAQGAGPVDILFNCAGFVHQGTILDATEDEWAFAFDLNCRSMFRTMRAFLPGMLARGHGVDPEHGLGRVEPEGRAVPLHL